MGHSLGPLSHFILVTGLKQEGIVAKWLWETEYPKVSFVEIRSGRWLFYVGPDWTPLQHLHTANWSSPYQLGF